MESYNEFDENDPVSGGERRCVSELRATGVAPVPVADARQQAYARRPNILHPIPHKPKNARERQAPAFLVLDKPAISQLRQFFEFLDRWDREGPRGA